MMLTSLLCEARIWPVVWRRRLAYWLVGEKENLAFLVMLGLPVLGVAGIIYFAYVDGTRIEPAAFRPCSGKQHVRVGAKLICNASPRTSISKLAASRSQASTRLRKSP